MLFSRQDVSDFINRDFEPAWEMVRPVPIIRIEFGDGRVSTRTLHGNVASYVCAADGKVVDVVPGIYTPDVYQTALQAPRNLARESRPLNNAAKLARWQNYHRTAMDAIRRRMAEAAMRNVREQDFGKMRIERPIDARINFGAGAPATAQAVARPRTAAELANWLPLVTDTQINETERRLQIHQHLTNAELVQPEQIKRWLYREVLHADLDDPNLGLGDDFFAHLEER